MNPRLEFFSDIMSQFSSTRVWKQRLKYTTILLIFIWNLFCKSVRRRQFRFMPFANSKLKSNILSSKRSWILSTLNKFHITDVPATTMSWRIFKNTTFTFDSEHFSLYLRDEIPSISIWSKMTLIKFHNNSSFCVHSQKSKYICCLRTIIKHDAKISVDDNLIADKMYASARPQKHKFSYDSFWFGLDLVDLRICILKSLILINCSKNMFSDEFGAIIKICSCDCTK